MTLRIQEVKSPRVVHKNKDPVFSHAHLLDKRARIPDVHKVNMPLITLVLSQIVISILDFVLYQEYVLAYLRHLGNRASTRFLLNFALAHIDPLDQVLRLN